MVAPRRIAATLLLVAGPGWGCSSPAGQGTPTAPTGTARTGAPQGPPSASSPSSPSSPSSARSRPLATGPLAADAVAGPGPTLTSAIAFPPRNEPFEFRLLLERKYRDDLRRSPGPSFVDNEGSIVWTQEYLRYRVNGCGHTEAVQRTLFQVGGGGLLPVCAESAAGAVLFPPREEPFDFRVQLERAYREGLRRTASDTAVDLEGDVVWTQEYLRYRVNACTHTEAVERVFLQIDGRGVSPVCRVPAPPPPSDPNAAYQYAVNPTQVNVTADAIRLSMTVLTNREDAQWTATSDQPWLTIDLGVRGTGTGPVFYHVPNNLAASARTARLTVSGLSGLYPPAVHTVRQAGR